jgi:exodeoxyribonuclease V gamma subunit
MPFHLHTSNRTESLFREFVSRSQGIDPMEKRFIVTNGKGMRIWLKQRISESLGISANLVFLSPEQAVWKFAKSTIPELSELSGNPFSKERMAWKIRSALPNLAAEFPEPFEVVSSFLEEEDPLKKIQLCWEIASVFDGYLHYRPNLIENWKKQKFTTGSTDEKWQALLWNKISAQIPCPPLSTLAQDPSFASQGPSQLWFFGLSPIPPVHLLALSKYAEKKELHAFLLQPTDEYWREVLSNRERILLSETKGSTGGENDMFLELGPPLLGALGKAWQKFILQLEDQKVYEPEFADCDSPRASKGILRSLQDHLLAMPEGNDFEKIDFAKDDLSLQFHSCHGPQREVQVLQDFLLDQFNQKPDLKPNEVLVLCPNLQKYSALLKAAFDNPETPDRRIPYGLCDREWRSESRVVDTFYHLLEFAEGRATARDFFTLVSRPVLCEKFDLNENDLEVLHWWIEQTRIAWGFDEEHKESMGVPGFPENTWRQGLDRMMLGFCSGDSECEGFEDLLPFDEIEGSRVSLLSKLVSIADDLQSLHDQCAQKHSPYQWRSIIERYCLETFFKDDKHTHADLVELRKSLEVLTNETLPDADLEPLSVIRLHLERTLNDKSLFSRHLTHGVTFSSLRSARGIPAKIICHIGLDGGSFPRPTARPSFDLCKLKPTYGDRNQAEEDRLLVMESILCARECLYFSFRGQSNRNNKEVPPSVVIEEILEQLDELIDFPNEGEITSAKEAFLFKHSLQPFGKKYFSKGSAEESNGRFLTSSGARSFSKRNCEAAFALAKPREEQPSFCPEPIARSAESSETIQLEDLVGFWKGPCTYLLKREFLISTWEEESLLPENERLDACARKDSSIKTRMIAHLTGKDSDIEGENKGLEQADGQKDGSSLFEDLRREGLLPPGNLGRALNSSLEGEVRVILKRTPIDFKQSNTSVFLTKMVDGVQVEGECGQLFKNTLAMIYPSKLKGRHCMDGLIRHLWANAYGPFAGNVETVVAGLDQSLILKPREPAQCISQVSKLIELFREGLTRPLPFFPNASLAWLVQTKKHEEKKPRANAKTPNACAQDSWNSDQGGEGKEFAANLCFFDDPWELEETKQINKTIMEFLDKGGSFIQ